MNTRNLLLFASIIYIPLAWAVDENKPVSLQPDNVAESKQQAKNEMNAIADLLKHVRSCDGLVLNLTRAQKAEIGKRSLRAWNLDPTYETAAYYACLFYRWTFSPDGEAWASHGTTAREETVKLIRKYKEQFHYGNPLHLRILELLRWNYALTSREKLEAKAEVSITLLKYDIVKNTSYHCDFLGSICRHIKQVGLDDIDSEYEHWKKYYQETLLPAWKKACKEGRANNKFYYSWEMVDAYYYARLKNSKEVIKALQSAANKYPVEDENVWKMYYGSKFGIKDILKILGDRKYKSWQPRFHSNKSKAKLLIRERDFYARLEAFCGRMNPKELIDIKVPNSAPIKLSLPNVKLPQICEPSPVSSEGIPLKFPVQPLGIINKKWWLYVSPLSSDLNNLHYDQHLAIGKGLDTSELNGDEIDLIRIRWPEYPVPQKRIKQDTLQKKHLLHVTSYYIENGKNDDEFTLWVGAASLGLAKFTYNENGDITSRWFTTYDGLPEETSIEEIFPATYKGNSGLLMYVKYDVYEYYHGKGQLIFYDSRRNKFILIKDNISRQFSINFEKCQIRFPFNHLARGLFSSNKNLCQWANAFKDSLEYLPTHDLVNAKIKNNSFLPIYSLGISCENGSGSIFLESRQILHFSNNYRLKRRFDNIRMPRLHSTDQRYGMLLPESPILDIGHIYTATICNGYVVIFSQRMRDGFSVRGIGERLIRIWKPGRTDPFINDKWYGPFSLSNDLMISSIFPGTEKYVWLITKNTDIGLYRLDIPKAIALAEANSKVFSTRNMIDRFVSATEFSWRLNILVLLGKGRRNKVFEILDGIIKKNTETHNTEYFDALTAKAIIYSHNRKDANKAITLYKKLLSETQSPEYQYIAKVNMGHIYRKMQRYLETIRYLSEAEDYIKIINNYKDASDFKSPLFGKFMNYHNKWHISQAKRKFLEQNKKIGDENK